MPTVSTPAALPSHIEELLSTRASHVDAIAEIDATLDRVSSALGVALTPVAKPVPIAPVISKPAAPKPVAPKPVAAKAVPAAPKKVGATSKFGMSANDFVLAFVGASKGGASTQEINNHWKASGRSGTADNPMSILTKTKKLKRVKFPKTPGGPRGSKYTLI
jgi:hypothetical protein